MTEPYQPKNQWMATELPVGDEVSESDFQGFDGTGYIGRIRKIEPGKWSWVAAYPREYRGFRSEYDNRGFVETARQATQMVEEFWDRALTTMKD